LGEKIDSLFIETAELIFIASILYKSQKLPYTQKVVAKLDLLKFFLQIVWEIKALDNKIKSLSFFRKNLTRLGK